MDFDLDQLTSRCSVFRNPFQFLFLNHSSIRQVSELRALSLIVSCRSGFLFHENGWMDSNSMVPSFDRYSDIRSNPECLFAEKSHFWRIAP